MGFEQGAQDFSSNLMQWTRLGLQQQQYDQEDKRFNRRLELERGKNGMGPSYEDDLKKMQADATWPDIPSSVPTSTPGPLGVRRRPSPQASRCSRCRRHAKRARWGDGVTSVEHADTELGDAATDAPALLGLITSICTI
jgi:hypothetical protein